MGSGMHRRPGGPWGIAMSNSLILSENYKKALSEITSMRNELLDYARIDKLEPAAIVFVPFRPKYDLMRLDYGMDVKVNVFNNSEGFRALQGTVGISSVSQLRVMNLQVICASDRRQFVRIKTNLRGQVTLLAAGGKALEPPPPPVRVSVSDLSMGGAEIATPIPYAEGSILLLKSEYGGYKLEFVCMVRRISRKNNDASNYYGCRFEDISVLQEETLHKVLLRLQQERRSLYK